MKRLLCIVGSMDAGGAETLLMKIYRKLNRELYQMDFCVAKQGKNFYEDEILQLGGKIYRITPKSKGPIKNLKDIKNIVKENKYDCVMRVSQNSLSALELLAAKLGGAKKLIFRSSNSNACSGMKTQIVHYLFRWLTILVPNIKFAPSTEAAVFMFGKRCVKKGKVVILKNAIDLDLFMFDEEKRRNKRKELEIDDKFVIGHIGRFNNQKNHKMLIEVFNEIKEKRKNAILLLIGTGELENEIKQQVKDLQLENSVMFLGIRKDIPELLMAMDVFAFPSFYEGMPNTVIEAQATDLQCVISDRITKEAKIIDKVQYLSIDKEKSNQWVEPILELSKVDARKTDIKSFRKSGYFIESTVEEFVKNIFG